LSTPALLPQLLSPIKGTKGTTGRIVIPNLHRRRSGSATVFILPRLLGCVCGRIIFDHAAWGAFYGGNGKIFQQALLCKLPNKK
ncbi:MAG: hypothetical protein IJM98_01370, partial [Oscillospiraceae bacterium]|nr:hypothetical protein [Oscillospiraceae bacterium]